MNSDENKQRLIETENVELEQNVDCHATHEEQSTAVSDSAVVEKTEPILIDIPDDAPIQLDDIAYDVQEEIRLLYSDDEEDTEEMALTNEEENALLNGTDENVMVQLDPEAEAEKKEEVTNEIDPINCHALQSMPLAPYNRIFRRPSMDCLIMPKIEE